VCRQKKERRGIGPGSKWHSKEGERGAILAGEPEKKRKGKKKDRIDVDRNTAALILCWRGEKEAGGKFSAVRKKNLCVMEAGGREKGNLITWFVQTQIYNTLPLRE